MTLSTGIPDVVNMFPGSSSGVQILRIAGEEVMLLPHRVAYWPAASTLLVADLHLGKADTWLAMGMPISRALGPAIIDQQLARLAHAITLTGARRVLVLGDLMHAPAGLGEDVLTAVARWRGGLSCELELVPGNHDRSLPLLADRWGLTLREPAIREGPFIFTHHPIDLQLPHTRSADLAHLLDDAAHLWAGHLHPLMPLRGNGDALRLPCFWVTPRMTILPAFGGFSSGATISPRPGDRVYAIADEQVIDVSAAIPRPVSISPSPRSCP